MLPGQVKTLEGFRVRHEVSDEDNNFEEDIDNYELEVAIQDSNENSEIAALVGEDNQSIIIDSGEAEAWAEIKVSVIVDNETVIEETFYISVVSEYYELYPDPESEINNVNLGDIIDCDTINWVAERHYIDESGNGQTDEIIDISGESGLHVVFDDFDEEGNLNNDSWEVTEGEGELPVLKRISTDYATLNFSLYNNDEQLASYCLELDWLDYDIDFEYSTGEDYPVIFDGDAIKVSIIKAEYSKCDLPNEYGVIWQVGQYDDEGEEITPVEEISTSVEAGDSNSITITTSEGCITADTYIVIAANIYYGSEENVITSFSENMEIKKSGTRYILPEDEKNLRGTEYFVSDIIEGELVNKDNPDGIWVETQVTDFKVDNTEIVEAEKMENGWNLCMKATGETTVSLTYLDDNNKPQVHTYTITVVDKKYECIMDAEPDRYNLFPGDSINLTTTVYVAEYDAAKDIITRQELDDYTVQWDVTQYDWENYEEVENYTAIESSDKKTLELNVNKDACESEIDISVTFYHGGDSIGSEYDYLFVVKEDLNGRITQDGGYHGHLLPGETNNYTFNLTWKKYDEDKQEVVEQDTSDWTVNWQLRVYDEETEEYIDTDLTDILTYEQDDRVLHVNINENWVDASIEIMATATNGEREVYDYEQIYLSKEQYRVYVNEFCAEPGDIVSVNDFKPQAILYNEENPQGKVDDYNFKFASVYEYDSDFLNGATINSDGTMTIPEIKNGRYRIGIEGISADEMRGEYLETFINVGGHEWDAGKVVKPATCTAAGQKEYTCKHCETTKQEEIPMTAHNYKTVITKATASKNGIIKKVCSCGKTESSTIYYPKTIKLSSNAYTYNGNAKTPSVTVYDSNGKVIDPLNYSISYGSGRKNVGKYKVTVTFKSTSTYYSGLKYTYYNINPKGTSISKVSGAKKAFTVKWKKQSSKMASSTISGYQIRYSTSSKMTNPKTVTVKGYKSTSKKISKLKAKKKYYVQVRTYKTVSGTKYYASWSKAKSVKTK